VGKERPPPQAHGKMAITYLTPSKKFSIFTNAISSHPKNNLQIFTYVV